MLFKIFGSVLILISTCRIGFKLASNLTLRTSELKDIRQGLCGLQNEMSFLKLPLGRAMKKCGQCMRTSAAELFDVDEEDPKADFLMHIKANDTHLKKEDLKVLTDFSAMLGSSDFSGQQRNFELCIARLDGQIKIAEDNCTRYEKMYRQCGVLGGLLLIVLLI